VQCLYCRQRIGPIRQLRDQEFCSEAHRTEFRERYRQQVYEALAPDPAPTWTADFMGRAPATTPPAPHAALRVLPTSLPGECKPTVTVNGAGARAERAGWIFRQAVMPTRLAWRDAAKPHPLQIRTAKLSIDLQPANGYEAGAAPTRPVAGNCAPRPLPAAARIVESNPLPPCAVSLPAPAQTSPPAQAGPVSAEPHAAAPVPANLAAGGQVPPAIHALALPSGTTFALMAPAAPPGLAPLPITFPQPPAVAASLAPTAACHPLATASQVRHAQNLSLPSLPQAATRSLPLAPMALPSDPQPAELPALPSWPAARTGEGSDSRSPLGSHSSPQVECPAAPIGALAELAQPESAPAHEAAGNRSPRSAIAAVPERMLMPAAAHAVSALPGALSSAPLHPAGEPVPAAPPAATPSWDPARAVPQDQPLIPLADLVLPCIECSPMPAGIVAGPGVPLPPEMGRAIRSCAVFWTLRVTHMCNPGLRMDPVRMRFNDLARADISYARDHQVPVQINRRPDKGKDATHSRKIKWQLVGAAAAALLLGGVLRPPPSSKSLGESPWTGASIREWMAERATRNFADDFRGGLNQWKGGQPKWPKSWSYSTDGYIHPGELALYRPSVPLSDYRFEFMAQIESKSVDCVVRAHDARNYYALKFTVLQPGPRPLVAMVRYPVIQGAMGPRVETPLRMMIHANTPYRVSVEVQGDRYRTFVDGQEADFWTDNRLKTGGVGFFSEAGEHARVYWVKLESHGDFLGRLCGLLTGKSGEAAINKEKQAWIIGMQVPRT
jgi:hypothetical protein